MTKIEPMTAAEYRAEPGILTTRGHSILAALEEREALLEQAKFGSADASVGALVRRVLDHPAATRGHSAFVYTHNGTWTTAWTEKGLQLTLSHLDSLLPKEPEVAPSGWTYVREDAGLFQHRNGVEIKCFGPRDEIVPPIDREHVAKLLEASRD